VIDKMLTVVYLVQISFHRFLICAKLFAKHLNIRSYVFDLIDVVLQIEGFFAGLDGVVGVPGVQ